MDSAKPWVSLCGGEDAENEGNSVALLIFLPNYQREEIVVAKD